MLFDYKRREVSVVFFQPKPADDTITSPTTSTSASSEPARVSELNLEELDLSGTLQYVLGDAAISALHTLRVFRLQTHGIDTDLTDFFRKCLTEWRQLRELDVRRTWTLTHTVLSRRVRSL